MGGVFQEICINPVVNAKHNRDCFGLPQTKNCTRVRMENPKLLSSNCCWDTNLNPSHVKLKRGLFAQQSVRVCSNLK
ncbi:hypothetical protein ACFX1S_019448 [Malus domestica]